MERTRRQNQNSYHDSDEVEGITVQGEISVDLARRVRTCCTCTAPSLGEVLSSAFRPSTRTVWPAHAAVPPAYSIVPFRPEQRRAGQTSSRYPVRAGGRCSAGMRWRRSESGGFCPERRGSLSPRRAKRPASYAYLELAYGLAENRHARCAVVSPRDGNR